MYPRNAASPERIAIGPVVQISDGAVQTSGVSIKVKPQGGSASDGGGTISYEEGIVEYLPTQAETNHTSFEVIAYKTGCIPVAATIVTTAAATPGTVLLAPVTHTSAVIPTVSTLTGHTAQTGDAFARLGAPAGASVSADVAAVKSDSAAILIDTAEIGAAGAGLTSLASASLLTTVAGYLDTEIAAILADTSELQADWANGGRLDLILDSRASQASVDVIDGIVDSILVDTAEIGAAGAGLTALATAAALATVAGYVDTEVAAIKAKTDLIPASPASTTNITAASGITLAAVTHTGAVIPTVSTLTGHTPQTGDAFARLGAPAGASVSADVAAAKGDTAAIKAKTDSLTFTVAGSVDANVQQINDVTITGNGGTGTEFGV